MPRSPRAAFQAHIVAGAVSETDDEDETRGWQILGKSVDVS